MQKMINRMGQQEQLLKILVDDLQERIKDGNLYLRGERLYNNRDLVKILKTSMRSLQRYRTKGLLPFMMLRNMSYYKESDVVKLLESDNDIVCDKRAAQVFLDRIHERENRDKIEA
jgi:hypothetical protein